MKRKLEFTQDTDEQAKVLTTNLSRRRSNLMHCFFTSQLNGAFSNSVKIKIFKNLLTNMVKEPGNEKQIIQCAYEGYLCSYPFIDDNNIEKKYQTFLNNYKADIFEDYHYFLDYLTKAFCSLLVRKDFETLIDLVRTGNKIILFHVCNFAKDNLLTEEDILSLVKLLTPEYRADIYILGRFAFYRQEFGTAAKLFVNMGHNKNVFENSAVAASLLSAFSKRNSTTQTIDDLFRMVNSVKLGSQEGCIFSTMTLAKWYETGFSINNCEIIKKDANNALLYYKKGFLQGHYFTPNSCLSWLILNQDPLFRDLKNDLIKNLIPPSSLIATLLPKISETLSQQIVSSLRDFFPYTEQGEDKHQDKEFVILRKFSKTYLIEPAFLNILRTQHLSGNLTPSYR